MAIESFHPTPHHIKPNTAQDLRGQHGIPSGEAQQEALIEAEESAPSAEVWRALQNSDEMSEAMAAFYNRSVYGKKKKSFSSSFERVLDDEAVPKSQKIIKALSSGETNVYDLLRYARSLFPDDSDLVLVLRELLQRGQLDELERKRLRELLKKVEEQADAKSLKAGINSALKAQLFCHILTVSAGLLRASYRQFLQSDEPTVEVYVDWIASYGHQARHSVLEFIEEALLADISAQDPSCSHSEFGDLLRRLRQLKLLRSADSNFILYLLTQPAIQKTQPGETAEQIWLIFMLSALQGYEADALLADAIGKEALFSRPDEQSVLLQTLYRACKEIPSELFIDEVWKEELLTDMKQLSTIAYQYELAEQRHFSRDSGSHPVED